MKRKLSLILIATALLCAMLLTSCGSFDYNKEDLSAYVTLGEYKGLSVTVKKPDEVTDETVDDAIKTDFEDNLTAVLSEDADYTAAEGDTVNIDYVGKIDGTEFEGGTDTKKDLVLGSDSLIDGFEDGLIGKKKGEVVDLNLKFPDPYSTNTALSGKAVVFTVTVNSISTPAYSYSIKRPDGTAATDGDTVSVDYSALADGKVFEGSTASGVSFVLGGGNSSFPEGIEAGLAGALVGETKEITVTLPADFADKDAAGKQAVYTVTVKSATRTETVTEINDAMIVELTDFETLEAYKADKLKTLTEAYETNVKKAELSALWKQIIDNATIKAYPKAELKNATQKNYEFYDGYAGYYYGVSLKDYATKYYGLSSKKEFKTEVCEKEAKQVIGQKLVFAALTKAEGWTLTDEEKEAGLKAYYEKNYTSSYDTYEKFVEAINVDTVYESILWDKGIALLFEGATATYN